MNGEQLILFKKFINENKYISNQIDSYPIDPIKKQNFIDEYTDPNNKSIVTELVNSVKHISNTEFVFLIKELCDKYNEVKKENDVYILVYIANMGSGSGGQLYNRKSSFYVTNITASYLNYDYIIDVTEKYGMTTSYDCKHEIANNIKNLNIAENKNIYLYFADDCSYSGEQIGKIITKFMDTVIEQYYDDFRKYSNCLYYRFIIPFILNKRIYTEIYNLAKISNSIINNFNQKNLYLKLDNSKKEFLIKLDEVKKKIMNENTVHKFKKISEIETKMYTEHNTNTMQKIFNEAINISTLSEDIISLLGIFTIDKLYLIDILPIIDILIKNNNMVKHTDDIVKNRSTTFFGNNYLVYLDHKLADYRSINLKIIPPIIGNCNYLIDKSCPPAGYTNIIYKLNNIQIIYDNTKTFFELLKSYDNQKSGYYNKYLKYKKKYLQLKLK